MSRFGDLIGGKSIPPTPEPTVEVVQEPIIEQTPVLETPAPYKSSKKILRRGKVK